MRKSGVVPFKDIFVSRYQCDYVYYEKEMWKGEFHQLDTYTTLLDLLSINQTWKGLGHTIMLPSYSNSATSSSYEVSNLIIEGDYFGKSCLTN